MKLDNIEKNNILAGIHIAKESLRPKWYDFYSGHTKSKFNSGVKLLDSLFNKLSKEWKIKIKSSFPY